MKRKAIKVGVFVVLVAAMLVTVAFGTESGRALIDKAAGRVESPSEAESLDDAFVGKNPQAVVAEMREIWLKAEAGDLGALFVFPEALTEEVGQRTLFEIGPPDLAEIQEAAAKGLPRGLVEMAVRYRDGEGVEQDLEEARRKKETLTQTELARKLRSSQSRVAKMEAGDPTVSIDLLTRSLIALGASPKDIARAIESKI